MEGGLFRAKATAAYVNTDTRGSLLSVAPASASWLLAAATLVLVAGVAFAVLLRVRVTVDGRGELRPSEPTVAVVAEEGTKVLAVRHAPGDAIHLGDPLFDIDTTDQEIALDGCERSAERYADTVAAAQNQLASWLNGPDPGEAIAFLLEARLSRAEELMHQEQARCDALRRRADASTIVSPRDGTLADVAATAGASAKDGEKLTTILPQTAKLRAYVTLAEADIGRVAEGNLVLLRFDAFPYERYGVGEGRVIRLKDDAAPRTVRAQPTAKTSPGGGDDEGDEAAQLVEIEIVSAPPGTKLRAGLRFTASIVTREQSAASLLIPH